MTEFIMENNIWLIIFGILIFMAMIGYSVEKKRETKKNDKTDNKKGKDIKYFLFNNSHNSFISLNLFSI